MKTPRNLVDPPALQDLATAFSEAVGQAVTQGDIRPVGGAAPGADVADATQKFVVTLPEAGTGFAIVSGPVNPDMVARAAGNIAQARALLPPEVAAPVLAPVATGRVRGLSFAVWPFRAAFLSGGKVRRRLRRYHRGPQICRWHIDVTGHSLIPAEPDICAENLETIARHPGFSDHMRATAQDGLARLQAQQLSLSHSLQHGDFWTGNILLPASGDAAPFFVIDWAGMNREGYPFVDLCSMLISLRCSHRFAARQIAALQARVGCDRFGLLVSVLNGLGYLGRHLEHFPPERYARMAEDVFLFADRTSGKPR